MRLTIERIRTLALAAGVLLIAAIVASLAISKWKNPLNRRDIPKRLGIDIQEEANGVTYTQSHGGHTLFKIHASRVVQLKNSHATLHDVVIELYGQNGSGPDGAVDRIQGSEFDYDQKTGMATAAGPVEITLTRLPVQPAAQANPGKRKPPAPSRPQNRSQNKSKNEPQNAIRVETSGLVFNQQSGIASTTQRVTFSSLQGSGSATGASYDSNLGYLVLDHDVELTTQHGANRVQIHAQHAEIDRDAQICYLRQAAANTSAAQAATVQAELSFRDDGSVERMDASGGLTVSTVSGRHLAAPDGVMYFNDDNQPRYARLTGGVVMDSASDGRTIHGISPEMDLEFNADGELRHAHMERGVEFNSREQGQSVASGQLVSTVTARSWRSPVADIDFRTVRRGQVERGQVGRAQVEPAALRGTGGVVLTGQIRRGNAPPESSRLAADEVTGQFGPNSTLTAMTGNGHASLVQTTTDGARQTATGDRLDARFAPASEPAAGAANSASGPQATQIESAVLDGHVVLLQQPAAKAGTQQSAPPLTATAGHAVYESAGQWLHLTVKPRVDDGGMEVAANRLDVSRASGDAFAHGNVKATWMGATSAGQQGTQAGVVALGGHGPAHVIAAEAELHQHTGEATFRGHARLWQDANSIAAPVIVIDRQKQTLLARTANSTDPVVAILVSATGPQAGPAPSRAVQPSHAPSVIRVRGGDLLYSAIERQAVMRSAPLSKVTAETGAVHSDSDELDLFLVPAGAAKESAAAAPGQIDRMTAIGHVALLSQGRRGIGQQLAYSSRSGDYVLTGTASAPPRLEDPQRGSVTGQALIFNTRDDSVSIEGGNHQTMTQTTAPR